MSNRTISEIPVFKKESWIVVQKAAILIFCIGFLFSTYHAAFYASAILFMAVSGFSLFQYGPDFFLSAFNRLTVYSLILVQTIFWGYNIYLEYYSLDFNYYDSGSFSNPISNFISGFGFYNSELGIHQLADHFCPNLLLLSPFYSYLNSGLVLIVARLLFYGLTFYALFRYSRFKGLGNGKTSFILFLWAINLGVNNFMGYEFQPSSLILPFIFFLFELADRKKYILFALVSLVIFGFKENAGLVLVSIGVYRFLYFSDYKEGTLIAGAAVVASVFVLKVLMPLLSGGQSIHGEMIDPLCCIDQKLSFLLSMLMCTGFILFLNPRSLLVVLPAMAVSLLSNRSGSFTLTFHYQDIPLAVSFAMLIHLLSGEQKSFWPAYLWERMEWKILSLLMFCGSFLIHSNSAPRFAFGHKPDENTRSALKAIELFRQKYYELPYWKTSTIWAQDCLAFYLSDVYKIRSLQSREKVVMDAENNFVVLCDFASGRWPIDGDYELLKAEMREQVAKGVRVEHTAYYPLIIFERKEK